MRFDDFNIFQRQADPDFLVAVPTELPLPLVLAEGWRLCGTVAVSRGLPDRFDLEASRSAIARDGYYVFDGTGMVMTSSGQQEG